MTFTTKKGYRVTIEAPEEPEAKFTSEEIFQKHFPTVTIKKASH